MTTNDFYSLIAQNDLTLVDFYATWCGPCKAMDPIIDRLSAMLNKRATIIRIDIDRKEHREIVARYNIVAVPTFVLFRDGEIVWRESGVMPIERIENAIRRQEEAMTAY
ncbi:thioredoxin [Alistipes sp.]|jgi:thioredoxin 1|nr:thioredoxin family protein [Alistipes sp.]GFI54015.1 thioredoxin [Alistipes sp.]